MTGEFHHDKPRELERTQPDFDSFADAILHVMERRRRADSGSSPAGEPNDRIGVKDHALDPFH